MPLRKGLIAAGERPTIVETESDIEDLPSSEKAEILHGNAAGSTMIGRADLRNARLLVVAIPETFEAGQIIEQARTANPALRIVARAHSQADVEYLESRGANLAIMGEREIARRMLEQVHLSA